MEFKFLKFCIGLCILLTFVLFVAIEYSFPTDVVSYVSTLFNQSELNSKLWLQGVSHRVCLLYIKYLLLSLTSSDVPNDRVL